VAGLLPKRVYGADRDRTGDLCSAIAALSQLSYSPVVYFVRPNPFRVRVIAPEGAGRACFLWAHELWLVSVPLKVLRLVTRTVSVWARQDLNL
jgi:hypothetical protein